MENIKKIMFLINLLNKTKIIWKEKANYQLSNRAAIAHELIGHRNAFLLGHHQENEDLEEAIAYQGVSKFPARIKCATLSWKAMERLLNGDKDE